MGRETMCTGVIGRKRTTGKLLLETDELIFRGEPRFVAPLAGLRADARAGWLHMEHDGVAAKFELGNAAARWAHAINNPKSRIDKLDVKEASSVAVSGMRDEAFVAELRARAQAVVTRLGRGPYDLIFYRVSAPAALDRLGALRARIRPAGAIWVILPKGKPELGHRPVVVAARAAGLVDVKTARFSATHTALKLMIPRADRPR